MSSDSDTDEELKLKMFLEAADTTLLNNSMFQYKKESITDTVGSLKKDLPKPQRYIADDKEYSGTDLNLPESMQKHLANKLSELMKNYYEFYNIKNSEKVPNTETKYKNHLKLLKGNNCCVSPYEDFEYETKGPEKKPAIKRRIVDIQGDFYIKPKDKFKLVSVDGNQILAGTEVKAWSKKKERNNKVFYYKKASNGVLYAKEETNEFTKLKHRNGWNENNIKTFKKK